MDVLFLTVRFPFRRKKKVIVTIEEEKPETLSSKIDERRKMYSQFCGIWTEKDLIEFKEATKEFEKVEPGEWI